MKTNGLMINLQKIIMIAIIAIIFVFLAYRKISSFDDGILNYNDPLQKKTKIWGDLNDDSNVIIQRMTEPDIGFYPSKMKLNDYADVIY
jgi:hypothetical protein